MNTNIKKAKACFSLAFHFSHHPPPPLQLWRWYQSTCWPLRKGKSILKHVYVKSLLLYCHHSLHSSCISFSSLFIYEGRQTKFKTLLLHCTQQGTNRLNMMLLSTGISRRPPFTPKWPQWASTPTATSEHLVCIQVPALHSSVTWSHSNLTGGPFERKFHV